ncbi:MAG: hypothetical protein SWX82_35250 [Cyanobacteriota bacterium]|nr:hypothetical protein [Cyanobacteriota bacterium]
MSSSQSSGGIRGVKDGLINIGVISKQLTAAETSYRIRLNTYYMRWGDGEMGRWGDGEMGRWGDGEMGRWGI